MEKNTFLGGNLNSIFRFIDGSDPESKVKDLVEELQSDEKIRIYTQAQVTEIDGYVGTTNPNKNVKRYR